VIELVVVGLAVWWFLARQARVRRTSSREGPVTPRARHAEPLLLGPPPTNTAVEAVGLVKRYRGGRGGRLALDGLDLAVPVGGVFGLLGPNGSGKTTALRCLLGLVHPTSGSCRVLGADSRRDLHQVADRVGALVEAPGLSPTLSGRRNLAVLARLDGIGPSGVQRALERTGLADRADDPVAGYSLGMRQQLGVAIALLRDPDLLILDEPANGLDPAGIAQIRQLLRSLADEGRTVLVSSHLLDEVEKTCDHIAVIQHGRCLAAGPVADILAAGGPGSVLVRVADLAAARQALAAAGIDSSVEGARLRVQWPPADAARISEVLAGNHLYPSEIRSDARTLETVFFELTGPEAA
jgi:ABC-type multidrug transport system ATPase subunit